MLILGVDPGSLHTGLRPDGEARLQAVAIEEGRFASPATSPCRSAWPASPTELGEWPSAAGPTSPSSRRRSTA